MAKRKSIGCDPLDWIGESGAEGRPAETAAVQRGAAGPAVNQTLGAAGGQGAVRPAQGGEPTGPPPAMLALPESPPPLQIDQLRIERQLLLVEEEATATMGRPARPFINQRLWSILLLTISLGVAILLFQETRRQWRERIAVLDRTLDLMEKEKERNERVLSQVISEKEGLIREKQGALTKAEALRQEAIEELRRSRAEGRRLELENRSLLEWVLGKGAEGGKETLPGKPEEEENR